MQLEMEPRLCVWQTTCTNTQWPTDTPSSPRSRPSQGDCAAHPRRLEFQLSPELQEQRNAAASVFREHILSTDTTAVVFDRYGGNWIKEMAAMSPGRLRAAGSAAGVLEDVW
jgi:hypothetical protein